MEGTISETRGGINVRLLIFPRFGCNLSPFWVISFSEGNLLEDLLRNFFDNLEEEHWPIFERLLRQKGFHCWAATRKFVH